MEEHLPKKKILVEEKKKNKENKLKTWKHQKKGLEDAKKDLKIQERFEGFGIKKKKRNGIKKNRLDGLRKRRRRNAKDGRKKGARKKKGRRKPDVIGNKKGNKKT